MRRTRAVIAIAVVVTAVSQLAIAGAGAAEPNQVENLAVTQAEGYATLAWTPVPGATDYQIERAPVSATGVVGTAVVVGLWQGQRTIRPSEPRFADAGFALGGTYRWRVRARFGTTAQPYSEPVVATTRPQWGDPARPGQSLRTGWETSGNATYTTYDQELTYTAALDAASDRMRVVEIGRTNPVATGGAAPGNRAINMFILGHPAPKATAQEISETPTLAYNCNVHGNEPQGREACFIFARMLATSDDPRLIEILSQVNVLIVPSINGNGRAANIRGNETGADLNRDHAELLQPETLAFARMIRDYTPDMAVDLHEGDSEDLPILTSRHLNVYEPLFREGKEQLVEGWLYGAGADSGWWFGPYSTGGDSHEGILRNTLGLKSTIGLLAENRASGGTTRPAEGTSLANRNRKSYGGLYEIGQVLDYFFQRKDTITRIVRESEDFNRANVGRVVLRGSYPWPYNPLLGANTGLPDTDTVQASRIIDPAPCGYFVTEAQYSGPIGGPNLATRLDAHGVAQETRPSGHIVRLAQKLRGLIPMMFDTASASPSPIVPGVRLMECPHVTAAPRTYALAAVAGTATSASLAIGNIAPDGNSDLDWTITEAATDCASPSDIPWLSASSASGSTATGATDSIDVTASAADLAAPARLSAVLCLRSNDAGEALITIPVSFQVQYAFTGFFSPIADGLNDANAGSAVPAKFVIGGGSPAAIVDGGSPTSHAVDCETGEALGAAEPIDTPGSSGFRYREADEAYHVNWKTDKSWAGTCRALSVALDDGTSHSALFRFH